MAPPGLVKVYSGLLFDGFHYDFCNLCVPTDSRSKPALLVVSFCVASTFFEGESGFFQPLENVFSFQVTPFR